MTIGKSTRDGERNASGASPRLLYTLSLSRAARCGVMALEASRVERNFLVRLYWRQAAVIAVIICIL